jgi:hypothetical protein
VAGPSCVVDPRIGHTAPGCKKFCVPHQQRYDCHHEQVNSDNVAQRIISSISISLPLIASAARIGSSAVLCRQRPITGGRVVTCNAPRAEQAQLCSADETADDGEALRNFIYPSADRDLCCVDLNLVFKLRFSFLLSLFDALGGFLVQLMPGVH